MIKPTNLAFNFLQIAHTDTALAIGATPYYNYVNGKPESDSPAGIKLEVVLPENRFEKLFVKLEGTKHPLTPESFENDSSYKVRFSSDFQAKFYRTPVGDYALSCKASSVEVIK